MRDRSKQLSSRSKTRRSTLLELVDLMRHRKKWWLAPIIVAVLVIGALAVLASTGAAPFIYTLF